MFKYLCRGNLAILIQDISLSTFFSSTPRNLIWAVSYIVCNLLIRSNMFMCIIQIWENLWVYLCFLWSTNNENDKWFKGRFIKLFYFSTECLLKTITWIIYNIEWFNKCLLLFLIMKLKYPKQSPTIFQSFLNLIMYLFTSVSINRSSIYGHWSE